jgi:ABC-type transporter Mla subunit MlaD
MVKTNDLESLTNSVRCLIVFENKTASLYKDLAERTNSLPLVKSLLLEISLDSQKHSTVMKGLVQSLPKTMWKNDEVPKSIANAWKSIDDFQGELSDVEDLSQDDLQSLSRQLTSLEGIMEEAYDILVQYVNLEVLSFELDKLYNVDREGLKTLFFEIIHDEEHHKEILAMISFLLSKKKEKTAVAAPMVRFRNPDAWSRPAPPNV